MKRNPNAVSGRQQKLLELLKEKGEIPVKELSERFNVSLMTIRRDLHELEARHLADHRYGKAIYLPASSYDEPLSETLLCREKIASYAAAFVEDGDRIFINGSSTALKILKYIENKKIKVFTNNIRAVDETFSEEICLNLTGGEVRGHVLVGDYVMKNLLTMHADKTFLGCAAVFTNGEFRYDIPTEIGINESMISRTKGKIYFLADHMKIYDHTSFAQGKQYGSCIYDGNITLITDDQADPECIEKLRATGMEVILIS